MSMITQKKRLYPCFETEEELALKKKSLLSSGKPPIYDRSSLNLSDEEVEKKIESGIQPHWRFKLDDENISWKDSKNYLPIFLYTGTLAIKNKEGKVTTQEPIFKLKRVVQNPKTNGTNGVLDQTVTVVEDISEIPKRVEEMTNSSVNALKSIKQL